MKFKEFPTNGAKYCMNQCIFTIFFCYLMFQFKLNTFHTPNSKETLAVKKAIETNVANSNGIIKFRGGDKFAVGGLFEQKTYPSIPPPPFISPSFSSSTTVDLNKIKEKHLKINKPIAAQQSVASLRGNILGRLQIQTTGCKSCGMR